MPREHDLRALLFRHVPADEGEAHHLQRMRALCEEADVLSGRDPCMRDHFVPGHFTASAFIVSPAADALLLIFHGKLKRWLQPGGHIDAGDGSVLEAARREVHEEVGLRDLPLLSDGIFDLDIHDIPPLKGDPGHVHFDVRFAFRARDLTFCAATDAEAGRWQKLTDIDEASSDRSVMRAVRKLQAR